MGSALSGQVRAAVASNVRHARLTRGFSIRDLAQRAGISKALLSQVERGLANPTVEVLAGLAAALGLSFADLVRTPLYEPRVTRRTGEDAARTLLSSSDGRRFELYETPLPPEHAHESAPHGRGSEEFAYVLSGVVTVAIATYEVRLEAGDAVRFSAEAEHAYRTGVEPVRLLTLVSMPSG